MKRLILLSMLILSLGIAKEHYNPNGRPGTLNVKISFPVGYELPVASSWHFKDFSVNIPIATWMTIKWEILQDYYETRDTFNSTAQI